MSLVQEESENTVASQLHQAQEEAAWQVDALTKLHTLAEKLTRTPELDEALRDILETVVTICGADFGLLTVYDAATDRLQCGASVGYSDAAIAMLACVDIYANKGCCTRSFVNRSLVTVADAPVDEYFDGMQAFVDDVGFRTATSTPILTRTGEALGVLSVQYREVRESVQREIQMMNVCARYAASALEALRNQKALQTANDELELRVKQRTQQLRNLAVELSRTEERERRRLARELHDNIQQLLVAIKMQAHLARTQASPAQGLQGVLELAEEAIAACRTLVLDISPPVLRDADLGEALQWLGRRTQELHGLRVEVSIDGVFPHISEDLRALVFDGVRELLLNTVKHSGTQEAKVDVVVRHGELQIEVSDEGNGCDADKLDGHSGDSFGLFSLRERLSVLGGELTSEASPGKGCRVRLRIAIDNAGPAHGPIPPAQAPTDTSDIERPLRVLLADDHAIVRQGIMQLLSSRPEIHVVALASNGQEAIDLARQLEPDVVLLDLTMPVVNGIEATRIIRREMPHIRVIGLSMHESDEMANAMLEAGAEAFLNKADAVDELLRVISPAEAVVS